MQLDTDLLLSTQIFKVFINERIKFIYKKNGTKMIMKNSQ